MFDQLVESSAIKKKSNRWAYFLVTATLWMILLTGVIVWGIMAFDAKLNEQFNALTLLAPPPPPPPPPPPAVAPLSTVTAAWSELIDALATITARPLEPPVLPNIPPTPLPQAGRAGKLFLPRDPKADTRSRQGQDRVAEILNSLIAGNRAEFTPGAG